MGMFPTHLRRTAVFAAAVAALCCCCPGCASASGDGGDREKPAAEYARIELRGIEKEGASIIREFLSGDFEKYVAHLPRARREKLDRKSFVSLSEKFRKQLGEAKWIDFMGKLRQGDLTTYIWNVGFLAPATEKDPAPERFDMLYRITVQKRDGVDVIVQLGWSN